MARKSAAVLKSVMQIAGDEAHSPGKDSIEPRQEIKLPKVTLDANSREFIDRLREKCEPFDASLSEYVDRFIDANIEHELAYLVNGVLWAKMERAKVSEQTRAQWKVSLDRMDTSLRRCFSTWDALHAAQRQLEAAGKVDPADIAAIILDTFDGQLDGIEFKAPDLRIVAYDKITPMVAKMATEAVVGEPPRCGEC